MKKLKMWEALGVPVIVVLGCVFHFVYGLSGSRAVVGMFAPVNESVWEHLKLGFWPVILYSLVERQSVGRLAKNWLVAKTPAVYLVALSTLVLFYGYTAMLGRHMLLLDIMVFVIAIAIGQMVSYRLLSARKLPQTWHRAALFLMVLMAVLFVLFTFRAPNLPVFREQATTCMMV